MNLAEEIRRTQVSQGELMICWLGQAGYLLKDGHGCTLAVDPYLTNCGERIRGFKRLSPMLLPAEDFELVKTTGNPVFNSPREMKDGKLSIEQTIVPVPNGDYLVIARDVTEEQESHRKTEEFRRETMEITQKVIDKQMRVAQEIASLLGETTAETKVALTSLKKSMEQGEDGAL